MLDKAFWEKEEALMEKLRNKWVKTARIEIPEDIDSVKQPKGKQRKMRKDPTGKRVRKY